MLLCEMKAALFGQRRGLAAEFMHEPRQAGYPAARRYVAPGLWRSAAATLAVGAEQPEPVPDDNAHYRQTGTACDRSRAAVTREISFRLDAKKPAR